MTTIPDLQPRRKLPNFPVQLFAVVMGVAGLGLAVRGAEGALGTGHAVSAFVLGAAFFFYLAIAGTYAAKLLRHRDAIAAEWSHPIKSAFFPAIAIGLLLLSVGVLPQSRVFSELLWWPGMILQGAFALAIISNWIGSARQHQINQLNPAWFIPAVGNVVVPLAGAQLGYVEISWLFFSAGMLFWIVLLSLVFNRLLLHDPLPSKLLPTLAILIAPPAVGFISYVRLTGEIDAFAHILLSGGYVFALVVATQIGALLKVGFALSWWALTFPVAALSVASFHYGAHKASQTHEIIGMLLLSLVAVAVVALAIRTIKGLANGSLLQPD